MGLETFQIFLDKKIHIVLRNILGFVARILFNNDAQQILFNFSDKWLRNSGLGANQERFDAVESSLISLVFLTNKSLLKLRRYSK